MGRNIKTRKPKLGYGAVKICTTIPKESWIRAVQANLCWTECLIIGISTKLSQKGDKIYNNPTQLSRKVKEMREVIGLLNDKLIQYEKDSKTMNQSEINLPSNEVQ